MCAICSNETAYMTYFSWRKTHKLEQDYSRPNMCDLCEKLNTELAIGIPDSNLYDWYFKDSGCVLPR